MSDVSCATFSSWLKKVWATQEEWMHLWMRNGLIITYNVSEPFLVHILCHFLCPSWLFQICVVLSTSLLSDYSFSYISLSLSLCSCLYSSRISLFLILAHFLCICFHFSKLISLDLSVLFHCLGTMFKSVRISLEEAGKTNF